MLGLEDAPRLAPEDDLYAALSRLADAGVNRGLVLDGDRLAGYLAVEDVARALAAGLGDSGAASSPAHRSRRGWRARPEAPCRRDRPPAILVALARVDRHASPQPIVITTSARARPRPRAASGTPRRCRRRARARASTTAGLICSAGALPAERMCTRSSARRFSSAAAIWLRPAFWTHTNSTSGTVFAIRPLGLPERARAARGCSDRRAREEVGEAAVAKPSRLPGRSVDGLAREDPLELACEIVDLLVDVRPREDVELHGHGGTLPGRARSTRGTSSPDDHQLFTANRRSITVVQDIVRPVRASEPSTRARKHHDPV